MQNPTPEQASHMRRMAERARLNAAKLKPDLNPQQQAAINAGTNAILSTIANFSLAALAGLAVGRLHPTAPKIAYALMATATGVMIAEKNSTIGNLLAAGGMVTGSALVMEGVARLIVDDSVSVSSDPYALGRRVGDSIYGSPSPGPSSSATPSFSMAPAFTHAPGPPASALA